ncbi:putative DNA-binding transcriptional regulator AlpA [Paraburkholderia sp. CI2]|uniref:helix-turn-helix transcriptional regulator n=1 Tax=Paraburkholderia sp. CI2 TaxID=2723093 RepID=UPI0017B83594|nr:AlpA family phage regulatory protein [Paraburkholderia sp. CI2]MBB5469353.1 putative DNA-binding transcriptional regulator AlpA [Paraburkholderia sp. CI2]
MGLRQIDIPAKERFMRLPEVMARTGLIKQTIYMRMAEATFPQSIKIGKTTVAWRESEIDAWIIDTIAESERRREQNRKQERKIERQRERERARQGETECAA